MPLWGLSDASTNAVKYAVRAGATANGATMYGNVTPNAFSHAEAVAVGVFGVDKTEAAVADGKITSPGWVVITQGTGPASALTISNGGATYGNLAVIEVSNGVVNALFHAVTNSTGGITSATLVNGGKGFLNAAAVAVVDPANSVVSVAVTAAGGGYVNGEVVTFSNGQINATATVVTNATGNITSVTLTSGGRGFINATATDVAIATAAGSGATLTPSFKTGDGNFAAAVTLGGRAGRINYETLVATKAIASDGTDDSILPDA